jgi:hypothetical protein
VQSKNKLEIDYQWTRSLAEAERELRELQKTLIENLNQAKI